MASFCSGGEILMSPDKSVVQDELYEYPFGVPKIILDGVWEQYMPPKDIFSEGLDSVLVVREKVVTKYTKALFTELLVKDKSGNTMWFDSRKVPFDGSWKCEYLGEWRDTEEFMIETFDFEKNEKKKYKTTLEETTPLGKWDIERFGKYIDTDQNEDKEQLEIDGSTLAKADLL